MRKIKFTFFCPTCNDREYVSERNPLTKVRYCVSCGRVVQDGDWDPEDEEVDDDYLWDHDESEA